jgi:peptidoglycan/LPS O-acetylase OafA/YrhL
MAFALRRISDAETSRGDPRPGIEPSNAYFPELEGLRGLAILLVLAFHCEGVACMFAKPLGEPCTRMPLALLQAGHTGVSLFFVLSAFLLSLPFFRQAVGGPPTSAARFYQRRALRILPLYWTVLIAGAALFPSAETLRRTLPYLFFVNGLWPSPLAGLHTQVMWSLATEVQFYAILPCLFVPLGARGRRPAGVIFLVVFLLAYMALLLGGFVRAMGDTSWLIGISILGRGPVFLSGMAAAWVYVKFGTRLRAWRPLVVGGDLLLVASLAGLEILLRPIARDGFLPWEIAPYIVWHVAEGALWALVLLLLVTAPLRLRVLFVKPAMCRLGVLSYSIYLLHWPLILWAGRMLHSRPATVLGIAILPGVYLLAGACVALAAVTYRVIERPFLAWKTRMDDAVSTEPDEPERVAA